jgi:hypothetical protein
MVPHHPLLGGLLFLLRLILLPAVIILGVVWKEGTPALVVSVLVEVIVREEWIVVIVTVVCVVMLVGYTVGPLAL